MSCSEITAALDWAKQTTPNKADFPVTAFFTRHAGILSSPSGSASQGRDFCRYAVGLVEYIPQTGSASRHLAGDLTEYWNGGSANMSEAMNPRPGGTVRVEIFEDGTLTFQEKLNGNPIGGFAPSKVNATCVGGVLLTGTNQSEVVVLGLRREPSMSTVPPS